MDNNVTKVEKNKNRLKKLRIASVSFILLGIISLICGICIKVDDSGLGNNLSKNDPADYYDMYYGVDANNSTFYTLKIEESGYILKAGNGLVDLEIVSNDYEYLTTKQVYKKVSISDSYKDSYDNALVLDQDDGYIVLWVENDAPYSFMMVPGDVKFTKEAIDFSDYIQDDPDNYYGAKYYCNSVNKLTLNANGTASYTRAGVEKTYDFCYVDYDWMNKWGYNNTVYTNGGFVLYSNQKVQYVFVITNEGLEIDNKVFILTQEGQSSEESNNNPDPKDYYGTYYSDDNYMYMKFKIKDTGKIDLMISTGYSDFDAWLESNSTSSFELTDIGFTYRNKEQAAILYPDKANNRACLDLDSTVVLWIESSDPYTFKTDYNGTELTIDSNQGNVKTAVSDPENYYKTYDYDYSYYNYKRVRFNTDGTATLYDSGAYTTKNYKYIYVNKGWLEAWGMYDIYSYDYAIILYNDNDIQVFQYVSAYTLRDSEGNYYYN